jgi:hypothetical protein
MAKVQPAKGGRGRIGGLRAAARDAGVSWGTARRRRRAKLGQNIESGPISDPVASSQPKRAT